MTQLPPGAGPVDEIGPGTVLRDWRVTAFRARGAFGRVFAAEHVQDTTRTRALKVFDPVLSWAARSTLLREFEMLRGAKHPNLLRDDDAFDLQQGPLAGCVVFVLELAEADLMGQVAVRGSLPSAEVAAIGAQIGEGLQRLHADGHLHGDVKPANILRVGQTWKLGDFGVVTALEGSYAVACASTLDFRPPELSADDAGLHVHRAADVWALGVTLWVAATGRHPFVGADPQLRYAAVLRDDRVRQPAIASELAALLDSVALTRDPHARATAGELAARLRQLYPGGTRTRSLTEPELRPAPGRPAVGSLTQPVGGPTQPVSGPAQPVSGPAQPVSGPTRPVVAPEPAAAVRDAAPASSRARTPARSGARSVLPAVGIAAVGMGVLVELCSLLAARVPGGLAERRVAYLVGVLLVSAVVLAVWWRRRPRPSTLLAAVLAALLILAGGTAFLFLAAG